LSTHDPFQLFFRQSAFLNKVDQQRLSGAVEHPAHELAHHSFDDCTTRSGGLVDVGAVFRPFLEILLGLQRRLTDNAAKKRKGKVLSLLGDLCALCALA
jgi:hypothetical protein